MATSSVASRTIVILGFGAHGPVTQVSMIPIYKTCIDYLQSYGVKVVGYVHTKNGFPNIFGYRTKAAVFKDVKHWATHFPSIDGIFVDEVSNSTPE